MTGHAYARERGGGGRTWYSFHVTRKAVKPACCLRARWWVTATDSACCFWRQRSRQASQERRPRLRMPGHTGHRGAGEGREGAQAEFIFVLLFALQVCYRILFLVFLLVFGGGRGRAHGGEPLKQKEVEG